MRTQAELNVIENQIIAKYGPNVSLEPKEFSLAQEKVYCSQLKNERKRTNEEFEKKNGIKIAKKICERNVLRKCSKCNRISTRVEDQPYLNVFDVCFHCYVLFIERKEQISSLENK